MHQDSPAVVEFNVTLSVGATAVLQSQGTRDQCAELSTYVQGDKVDSLVGFRKALISRALFLQLQRAFALFTRMLLLTVSCCLCSCDWQSAAFDQTFWKIGLLTNLIRQHLVG